VSNQPDLDNFLIAYSGKEFKYGLTDCAHFTADYLQLYHGKDFLINFRTKYTSPRTSVRRLKELGYDNIVSAVSGELGSSPISPIDSVDGDVLVYSNELGQDCIGVCHKGKGIFITHIGLLLLQLEKCKFGWRVNNA